MRLRAFWEHARNFLTPCRNSFRVSPHVRLPGDIFYPRGTSKLRSFELAKVLRPFSYDPRIVFHRSDESCHQVEMIMFGKRVRQRGFLSDRVIFLVSLRFLMNLLFLIPHTKNYKFDISSRQLRGCTYLFAAYTIESYTRIYR